MASGKQQLSCTDYHVAWICALPEVELLPARLMLDEEHLTPPYDTHYDENTYICGTIKGHTVVVATCPLGETGNVNSGRLTGPMFKTFPNIRMAVLVGIGGGVPHSAVFEDPLQNIHLGDVVVGWPGDGKPACVYHDRGKAKADGNFELVGTMQNPDWRLINALGILGSNNELGLTTFYEHIQRLQRSRKFSRPRFEQDKLFKPAYPHVGEYKSDCLACDRNELVQRPPRTEEHQNTLVFHQGRIATGNSVIKDAIYRDKIGARCDGALCVEMEAAGVDVNRKCLVIRGISDYADSHKNDTWKYYAAGNAAVFTRELLCTISPGIVKQIEGATEGLLYTISSGTIERKGRIREAPWLVPFPRPYSFVGREDQLSLATAHVLKEDTRRLAIYGLGGCGKTALVLELAYRTRELEPARAIFWMPAMSQESFEQAYRDIATLLRLEGFDNTQVDVKLLVKSKLSDESFGQWLLIVDNADDADILLAARGENNKVRLIDFLPHSRKGSIVFTTRTRGAAVKLAQSNILPLGELTKLEATEILRTRLREELHHQLQDEAIVDQFCGVLTYFALAIVQATAFMNINDMTLSDYLDFYRKSEENAIDLLSEEFEEQGRYRGTKNPIMTTWYISFDQIQRNNQLAVDHFSFMASTTHSNIPEPMLPDSSRLEKVQAIGMLKAYAFITERQPQMDIQQPPSTTAPDQRKPRPRIFDVHPLVHLAMRSWLKKHDKWVLWTNRALARVIEILSSPDGHFVREDYTRRDIWIAYITHAIHILGTQPAQGRG